MNEFFRILIGILIGVVLISFGIYAMTIGGPLMGLSLLFTGITCVILTVFRGK